MKISLTKKALAGALAIAVGIGLAATGSSAAQADDSSTGYWTPQGTSQPWFIYSLDTGVVVPAGTTLSFAEGVVAAPSATDPEQTFDQAPADATGVRYFISPRGKETDISQWNSQSDAAFMTDSDKRVLQPTSSLNQFPAGSFAAVKAAGGDYSLGIAYTKNNFVTIVGTPAFTWIHIEAGTGNWTFVTPEWKTTETVDPSTAGQIGIEATTVAATDGALSLSVPTAAKATLGAASLVDNLSTSTGTLPTFTVNDGRVISKPGWTVNTSVTDFVSGSNNFTAAALSVTPAVVTSGTTSTGVSAGSAFAAANSAHQFAEAPAGSGAGVTNLNAALTLVAPATAPAGTYTSTMTVTVVSK